MSISRMPSTPCTAHVIALNTSSSCSSSNSSNSSCYEQSCCKSAEGSMSQKQGVSDKHARTAKPPEYMRVHRSSHKLPLYTSKLLGQQRQVSIKLRSGLDMSSLPSDLAAQLQASLMDICGCSYTISQLAVREGCIVLRGDLIRTENSMQTGAGTASDSQAELLSLARAMLPCLQPILGEGKGQHRSNGEHVRLQHGNNIICCYWDSTQHAWQLVQQKAWDPEQQTHAQLGLVRVAVGTYTTGAFGNASELPTTSNMQGSSMQTRDVSIQPVSSKTAVANSQPVELLLQVQVQMSGQHADIKVTRSRPRVITGWVPPQKHNGSAQPWRDGRPAPDTTFLKSGGTIQILAHANGRYFETRVLQTTEQQDKLTTVVVCVRLPDQKSFNSLHHAGQKPLCLQLLTLELWCEELLLDTSTTMLPATLESSNNRYSSARQQPCWWWGSRPATVTAAVQEVAGYTQKLWVGSTSDMIKSYNQMIYDLGVYLTGVRITLQMCGRCRTTAAPSSDVFSADLTEPALNLQELQRLGNDLAEHAHATGMWKLHCMLLDQQQALARCMHTHSSNTAADGGSASGTTSGNVQLVFQLLYRLWVSIFGFSCWQCERAYRKRLSHHLANVQAVYAAVGFATVSMTMRDLAVKWSVSDAFRYYGWGIPVCIVGTQQFLQRVRPQPNTRHRTCSHISALCLLIIAIDWFTAATGMVQPSTTLLKMYRSFLGPVLMLLLSLGEQLGASVILPAPIVTLLAATIATCLTSAGAYVGPCWAGAILNVLVTVVARLLADMHLRGMLMAPSRSPARTG